MAKRHRTRCPWVKGRLEVELCAKLVSPGIGDNAACFAEVHVFRVAGVVAAQVVVIECVEYVESDSNGCRHTAEAREILTKPHIYVLIWEGSRGFEAATNKRVV